MFNYGCLSVPGLLTKAPILIAFLLLAACASAPPIDQVDLMPAPDVYGDGLINPLPETRPSELIPYQGILYATDRIPADPEDPEPYYVNDRGQVVRLGVARVVLGEEAYDWKFARDVSMMTARTDKYPIKIDAVDEWGILGSTVPP